MSTALTFAKRSNPNALSPRLASKLLALIIALTLVLGLLLCGVDKAFANPLSPRLDVRVAGDSIKLGDVFEGLEQNADFVLAPSPAPGQELVWNKPTLLRIATAFNLPWRPQENSEIRIRRAATLVDGETMKAIVRDHLATVGEDDTFNVKFTSEAPEVVVDGDITPDIQLVDFNMQQPGGTFNATLKITGGTALPQTVNLRGVAERMVRVPVLKRSMKNGDIIGQNDISWTTEKAATIRRDIVRDTTALIGATPRRGLSAGQTITDQDLQMPILVSRGDLVTIVFRQNGMYLTAKGRAMEDGAMGQVVKVSNTNSNRQLEAQVTNTKEVTIN